MRHKTIGPLVLIYKGISVHLQFETHTLMRIATDVVRMASCANHDRNAHSINQGLHCLPKPACPNITCIIYGSPIFRIFTVLNIFKETWHTQESCLLHVKGIWLCFNERIRKQTKDTSWQAIMQTVFSQGDIRFLFIIKRQLLLLHIFKLPSFFQKCTWQIGWKKNKKKQKKKKTKQKKKKTNKQFRNNSPIQELLYTPF